MAEQKGNPLRNSIGRIRLTRVLSITTVGLMLITGLGMWASAQVQAQACRDNGLADSWMLPWISQGASGDAVVKLQLLIGAEPDGDFGPLTRAALVAAQKAHGLPETGVADNVTWARLLHKPLPNTGMQESRIVLSQSQNWIWLVDGACDIVAQGGVVDNPALVPPGHYRVTGQTSFTTDITERLGLDNFTGFALGGQAGFHRIPYYIATGEQIHTEVVLGMAGMVSDSSGCVRVSEWMAGAIMDFAGYGTLVEVIA